MWYTAKKQFSEQKCRDTNTQYAPSDVTHLIGCEKYYLPHFYNVGHNMCDMSGWGVVYDEFVGMACHQPYKILSSK